MRFLVDAQLPPALARWLTAKGHHAEHVVECGLLTASDSDVWDHAVRIGATILTKDEDFANRRALSQGPPPIVWIRFGNARRTELLHRLEPLLGSVTEAIERGDTLVELT